MKRILSLVLIVGIILTICSAAFALTIGVTTTGKVHLRKGAGLGYKSLRTIPKNKTMTAKAIKFDGRGVAWYKVTYGKTGWVSGRNLKAAKLGNISEVCAEHGSTYVRKSAKKSAKAVATLHKGDYADFLGKASTDSRGVFWLKVDTGEKTGWVSIRYCEVY